MKVEHIQGFEKNVPSWQSILDNFNRSVLEGDKVKHNPLGFFVSHQSDQIPEVANVLNRLGLMFAHTYMNITLHGGTFGRHNDTMDVFYWQVQGITQWEFDDRTFILQPSDLISIPKGIYHNVVPLTPRAGISMSIE